MAQRHHDRAEALDYEPHVRKVHGPDARQKGVEATHEPPRPLTFVLSPPAAGERKCGSRTDGMRCDLLSPWGRGRVRGIFGSRAQCIRKRTYGVLTLILSPRCGGEEIALDAARRCSPRLLGRVRGVVPVLIQTFQEVFRHARGMHVTNHIRVCIIDDMPVIDREVGMGMGTG